LIRWSALILAFLPAALFHGRATPAATAPDWRARNFHRKTIYSSPQSPGYTAWVGAWLMPDDSLMVTFKQATGPVDGRNRNDYDFTGLDLANIYLRSNDGGATWLKTAEDHFRGPSPGFAWGGSHCALADGAILRAVDGSQLPLNNLPRRIFFQRSSDLGKTWGAPIIPPDPTRPVDNFLGDFGDCITRVRRLSDRRLLATGVVRIDPKHRDLGEPFLLFSADEGKTWESHRFKLTAPEMRGNFAWDEWDCAELSGGSFLAVFRRADPADPKKQVRWQGILLKRGDRWTIDRYRPAPFPHSGHPDLLATREGPILHTATTGIHFTTDAGESWQVLQFGANAAPYKSLYYPRTVQASNGRIYVFSHRGADNPYGKTDQSIVMDAFDLANP